jgi:DNA-binding CsgD family transcriptional regulator
LDKELRANDIILDIYDSMIDTGRWPAVLDKVAQYIGARGAFIFELRGSGAERKILAPHFSAAYDSKLVEGYLARHMAQELADQDTFARFSRPTDRIQLIADDVLAPSEADLLGRGNVKTMLEYGIRYRAGALLNKDDTMQDRFALQFSQRAGPISAEHIAKASELMPHLAKALNVSRPTSQLNERLRSVSDCLDMLTIGICVLNEKGSIVVANQEFRRQIDRYRIFRADPSGRLLISSDTGGRHFADLRASLSNHGRFGARPRKEAIVSEVDGEPHTLCIEVAPLTSATGFGEAKLRGHIVYSMDTGNFYGIDPEMLSNLFGLTDTESAILEMMTQGLTNAAIADRREKSVETVNSQVKSILSKTNSANRTQAIRLVTNISSSFVVHQHPQNGGCGIS